MTSFIFFMAAAPTKLVPPPDHRGQQLAVAIIPAALPVHKPGVFVDLARAVLIIERCKFHKPNPLNPLGIICFDHKKPQPLGVIAGVGQRPSGIDLPVIRITGGNEVIDIFIKEGCIPGSHQLFRCVRNCLPRKKGPTASLLCAPAVATAKFSRHSFPLLPTSQGLTPKFSTRYLFHSIIQGLLSYHGNWVLSTLDLPDFLSGFSFRF